jgi:type II secretory pathway predicted ATPase ExeA
MVNEKMKELFSWESNPFTFQIIPELFVGYGDDVSKMSNGIMNDNKFTLLLGPTGSGKTTLMKTIANKFRDQYNHVIYLPKPPRESQDWIMVFNEIIKSGGLRSFFSRGPTVNIYNLSERVNKKINGNRCLMLVDECHESSTECLEWLRTLTDHIDSLSIVMAGLPVFESMLKNNLESFMRRVNTKIELTNLTKSETRELIKKRIEHIGGDDIRPFTSGSIEHIYETTSGFPREIIRTCNELVSKAMDKNISTIDTGFVKETETTEQRVSLDSIDILPERQRLILNVLAEKGELAPNEIVNSISIEEYKNKDNAIRSVNNLLRRLMSDGYIHRKRIGKTYKYEVSSKFKTMLVNA